LLTSKPVAPGSEWLISAPAHPRPAAQVAALAALLERVGGVREAHLPQCYAAAHMAGPRQVLIVVLEPGADVAATMSAIAAGLDEIIPAGEALDMMELPDESPLLPAIRNVDMRVMGTPPPRPGFWKRLFS
jgi:hypothetical protein